MFDLTNKTKSKPPVSGLLFKNLKNDLLGEKYNLSLVIVGDALSKKLNSEFRKKNKSTNILSFPLDKNSGEIFLNLNISKKEAKMRGVDYKDFLTYLFIHGLLHLKGHDHGKLMTEKEKYWVKKASIDPKVLN